MRKILMLALAASLFGCGAAPHATPAASTAPAIRRINPPTLSTPHGYSHVVETRRGRTIYIAGQVALDRNGKGVGPGDLRAQSEQVFTNLQAALAAVGADFTHVVKLNFFVTELDDARLAILRDVRDRHIDTAHPPASTLVQVVRLFRPEFVIEVEAVAVVDD